MRRRAAGADGHPRSIADARSFGERSRQGSSFHRRETLIPARTPRRRRNDSPCRLPSCDRVLKRDLAEQEARKRRGARAAGCSSQTPRCVKMPHPIVSHVAQAHGRMLCMESAGRDQTPSGDTGFCERDRRLIPTVHNAASGITPATPEPHRPTVVVEVVPVVDCGMSCPPFTRLYVCRRARCSRRGSRRNRR